MPSPSLICRFLLLLWISGNSIGFAAQEPTDPPRNLAEIQNAAPEHPVFYYNWSGWDDFDPERSSTEKWLDQPELRQAFSKVKDELITLLRQPTPKLNQGRIEFFLDLTTQILASPTAIAVYDFQLEPAADGNLMSLSMISHLGEPAERIQKSLTDYLENNSPADLQQVELDGHRFFLLRNPSAFGQIYFRFAGQQFILGTDQESIHRIHSDVVTKTPEWLSKVTRQYSIEHVTGVTWLDLKKVNARVTRHFGKNEQEIWNALGFNQLTELICVTGLESKGAILRGGIKLNGEPAGLFQLLEPEDKHDLSRLTGVDPRADQIHLVYLPLNKLLPFVREMATQLGAEDPSLEPIEQLKKDVGVDAELLLTSLSGQATMYGKLTMPFPYRGWVLSLGIKDSVAFAKQFNRIVAFMKKHDEIELTSQQRNGKTFYSVASFEEIYFSRSDSELVIAINRRALSKYWKRIDGVGSDIVKQSEAVAELPGMSDLLENPLLHEQKIVYAGVIDYRPYVELTVPMLSLLFNEKIPGTDLSLQDAPAPSVLTKYWEPSLYSLYRSETGYDYYSRQTVPHFSPGAIAPLLVGSFLPALDAARDAAREAARAAEAEMER